MGKMFNRIINYFYQNFVIILLSAIAVLCVTYLGLSIFIIIEMIINSDLFNNTYLLLLLIFFVYMFIRLSYDLFGFYIENYKK